jgi:hypothetical protein
MNKIDAHQTGIVFQGDTVKLAKELRGKIRGEVRFDLGSRALYAADGSNYREVPIGIVLPRDVEDVTQTICRQRGANFRQSRDAGNLYVRWTAHARW